MAASSRTTWGGSPVWVTSSSSAFSIIQPIGAPGALGRVLFAPTATRRELGERSWKFSPTFALVHTAIESWQIGVLGVYNFPLDGRGTQSLLFQPLIVKQLGEGWYTGWGDDLWRLQYGDWWL